MSAYGEVLRACNLPLYGGIEALHGYNQGLRAYSGPVHPYSVELHG